LSLRTLQNRNPANIDWQGHFTAAVCLMFAATWALSLTIKHHETALIGSGRQRNRRIERAGLAPNTTAATLV